MNKSKVPSLVSIAILTAITSVFWIFFSVYRIFTTKPAPKVPEEILAPISPELDKVAIGKVQGRIFFEEGQIPQTSVTLAPTSTPSSSPSPLASPSATPIATASATPTALP